MCPFIQNPFAFVYFQLNHNIEKEKPTTHNNITGSEEVNANINAFSIHQIVSVAHFVCECVVSVCPCVNVSKCIRINETSLCLGFLCVLHRNCCNVNR